MTEVEIRGVTVQFPFKPYDVQEDYMSKVIECLKDGKNGVLESPTGTGKTLSLLCSSLAWLTVKKAQIQAEVKAVPASENSMVKDINFGGGTGLVQRKNAFGWSMPKIIYASRTHSQLSQAMQELKRTAYNHVNVAVLGSRDQLCINPDVAKEKNSSNKINMCQIKIKARSCQFYNNVEEKKEDPDIKNVILDIEDLVKSAQKHRCCPYFLAKELKNNADIIFMPYNYLLDPKMRKNQGLELTNSIILLDEAHNVEKMCEEAASLQISSTDIALCIDEITSVMKDMSNQESQADIGSEDYINPSQKDFTTEDLCILKTMFLEVEKAIDGIVLPKRDEGETFPGGYIFDLLEKAEITQGKEKLVMDKLEKIILYLATTSTSPFSVKGHALQKFCDLLRVVFVGSSTVGYRERIKQCYKVHIQFEPPKKNFKGNPWQDKKMTKLDGKLISYWCFSPGFGMQQLLDQGVRSVILTSGTLSPLKPFISEIGIDIGVQLENPHIVTQKQICVGVLGNGCDGFSLNSSFNTRNDPKYIVSLGKTIEILTNVLPHGLLIFFPSYPIMKKCQEEWQSTGIWSRIEAAKPIYVEPQSKETLNVIMNEYYQKVFDPAFKGATFMAVCRGKVSEGLDFANAYGRAVLITGLPFPPLKDPRIILKQRYLEENKISGKESLTGQQWYQLEASRAVNQAIGRIIRHKNDYGAILLCDCRFDNPSFKQQLSAWLRPHIKKFPDFRSVVKDMREFFKYAQANLPQPLKTPPATTDLKLPAVAAQFDTGKIRSVKSESVIQNQKTVTFNDNFDLNIYKDQSRTKTSPIQIPSKSSSKLGSLSAAPSPSVINFHAMKTAPPVIECSLKVVNEPCTKRRKMKIISTTENKGESSSQNPFNLSPISITPPSPPKKTAYEEKMDSGKKYLQEIKRSVSKPNFVIFKNLIGTYTRNENTFDEMIAILEKIFITDKDLKHLFIGFRTYLKKEHLKLFDDYLKMKESS